MYAHHEARFPIFGSESCFTTACYPCCLLTSHHQLPKRCIHHWLARVCTANLQQELHSLQLSQCSSTGRRGSDVIMCDQHIVSNADRVEPYLQIVSACSSMALFRMRMSCLRTEKLVSRHCSCAFRAFATAAATCTKLSCDRAVWSGSSFLLPVHPRKLLLHPASRCSPLCLMPSERFPRLLQWQDSCTPSGLLGRC